MSPSTPNRLFSNEVSGLEVDHRHIDRTVEVRSRLPDTLLIAVSEQLGSNSNPGRSAALKRAAPASLPAVADQVVGDQPRARALLAGDTEIRAEP